MSRSAIASLALMIALLACQGGEAPQHGVDFAHPRLEDAFETGVAVIPVLLTRPQAGGSEIVAAVTGDLYTSLLVSAEGSPVTSPLDLMDRVEELSEEERESYGAFRRDRRGKAPLDSEECGAVSALLGLRYLLVTRLDETVTEGVEDSAADITDARFADDVRRQQYSQIGGSLEGELIDLWTAEVLWSGSVPYATGKLFEGRGGLEIQQQRSRAAFLLANLLAQSRR